jgi:hypothetical protein
LASDQEVHPDAQEERLTRYLAAEGALTAVDGGTAFKMRAPLIRSLLINKVLPLEHHSVPKEPVPLDKSKRVVVAKLIETVLKNFDPELMNDDRLSKKTLAPRSDIENAPQEDVYQTELLSVFKKWFPRHIRVLSQPIAMTERGQKPGRPRHSDILIELRQQKILLELVAHTDVEGVEEHIRRAERDAAVLGAEEAWVLHFTTGDFGDRWPSESLEVPKSSIAIHVMDIQHDVFWTKAVIRRKGEEPKEVLFQ